MSSNAIHFLSKALGEDFLESLQKVELYKIGTKTTTDPIEIKAALKIVPKVILALLIKELSPMGIGEDKQVHLPLPEDPVMSVTKLERDVYTGYIAIAGKKISEFMYRSIPGVGLVIMTAFELYDVEQLEEEKPEEKHSEAALKHFIDERLALHALVNQVVDQKIAQKDAIEALILQKLTHSMAVPHVAPAPVIAPPVHLEDPSRLFRKERVVSIPSVFTQAEVEHQKEMNGIDKSVAEPAVPMEKGSKKLNKFLEHRKKKIHKKEFHIHLNKSETVSCPDCGNMIFNGSGISACICFAESSKVHLKKTEDGIKISFGKSWDIENIEMMLALLRGQNE